MKFQQHFEPFYYDADQADEHTVHAHFGISEDRADEIQKIGMFVAAKLKTEHEYQAKKIAGKLSAIVEKLKKSGKPINVPKALEDCKKEIDLFVESFTCSLDFILEPVKFGELKTVPEVAYYMFQMGRKDVTIDNSVSELVSSLTKTIFEHTDEDEDDTQIYAFVEKNLDNKTKIKAKMFTEYLKKHSHELEKMPDYEIRQVVSELFGVPVEKVDIERRQKGNHIDILVGVKQ